MAVELESFLTNQLARLPDDHPDRPFITGLKQAVSAYTERGSAAVTTEQWDAPAPERGTVEGEAGSLEDHPSIPAQGSAEAADVGQAEQERVTLKGRIGARPRFSTTPRGVPRAEFNLAVHEDDESTTWHTVLAFRQRAEKLEAANPQKGQYAEVIGYRHTEERKDREGNPKTVARIVAANIRLR